MKIHSKTSQVQGLNQDKPICAYQLIDNNPTWVTQTY